MPLLDTHMTLSTIPFFTLLKNSNNSGRVYGWKVNELKSPNVYCTIPDVSLARVLQDLNLGSSADHFKAWVN